MEHKDAYEIVMKLHGKLNRCCPGMENVIDSLLLALFSDGDILLDDYTGSGICRVITTLGNSIEDDCDEQDLEIDSFHHVIATEGTTIQDLVSSATTQSKACGEPGKQDRMRSIFSYVLFVENFNRLSGNAQAAITKTMRSKEVFVDGKRIQMGDVFCVIATWNRHDQTEKDGGCLSMASMNPAVRDQFLVRSEVPMPGVGVLHDVLSAGFTDMPEVVVKVSEVRDAIKYIRENVKVERDVITGVIELASLIGENSKIRVHGTPSMQCLLDFILILKTKAFFRNGNDIDWDRSVAWGDVVESASQALSHRILLKANAIDTPRSIIEKALKQLAEKAQYSGKYPCHMSAAAIGEYSLQDAKNVYDKLLDGLQIKVKGRDNDEVDGVGTLSLMLTALFAEGHLLFEDFPGTGKSYMCEVLGKSIYDDMVEDAINIESFHRVQATPDMLPSDITGYLSLESGQMRFKPGPVFAYVLLIDEINRTTPKVQSALLEAMAEKQVTIDATTYNLGALFFCVATQNPLDRVGTFELPAAQLDRFLFKRRLKPITRDAEEAVLGLSKETDKEIGKVGMMEIVRARQAILERIAVPRDNADFLLDVADAFESLCYDDGYFKSIADSSGMTEAQKGRIQRLARWAGRNWTDGLAVKKLKPGSRPSPRTLQKFMKVLKVLAFINGDIEDAGLSVSGEKTYMVKAVAGRRHIASIACDLLRHRLFPQEDDMGGGDMDANLDALIKATISEVMDWHEKTGTKA